MYILKVYCFFIVLIFPVSPQSLQKAKDNGDIYIVKEETFIDDIRRQMKTESALIRDNYSSTPKPTENPNLINFDELIATCNSSFYIPMRNY